MSFLTDKLIFYHIPKTGGSWVSVVLRNLGLRSQKIICKNRHGFLSGTHIPPSSIKDEDKKDKFSFCFIRHPLTWYRSLYASRIIKFGMNYELTLPNAKLRLGYYEEYIQGFLRLYPGFLTKMYQEYVGENLELIDYIGKQENLTNNLITVLNQINVSYNREAVLNYKPVNDIFNSHQNQIIVQEKSLNELCQLSQEVEQELLESEKWIIKNFY